jgi:hypothetical protein
MSDPLAMNPFADIHIHPAPEVYPFDVARIETIAVKCPVRGRGLIIHDLTRTEHPALFAFFAGLVASNGELALDSDAPLVAELARIGFLVVDDDVVDWPQLEARLSDVTPAAAAPADDRWIVSPTFRFQAAFRLHPEVRWPADYDEQDGRLRAFAPGPACWVGDPTGFVSPYWVAPDTAAVLAQLVRGAPPPPLADVLARTLAEIGAIHPADRPPNSLARFARHRAAFAADEYVVVRDLLPAAELAALRRYYGGLLAGGLVQRGDRQSPDRYSAYNDPVGRFVHARLVAAVSAIAGQPVKPSFSYLFSYVEGATLEPHKDRPQTEFSISLQIDHTPVPDAETGWPLRFSFDDGRIAAADLRIGDAVVYHGRTVTHHRTRLPAHQQSSVLVLEYVPHDFRGLLI